MRLFLSVVCLVGCCGTPCQPSSSSQVSCCETWKMFSCMAFSTNGPKFNVSHSTRLQGSGKTVSRERSGRRGQIVLIVSGCCVAVWLCGMVSRRNRRGGQNLRDATAAVNRWTRANLDQTDLYSHVDTGIWSHLP